MSSSNKAEPWKKAANQSAVGRETDLKSFPPLSAESQSKKQSRLRALYTQTPSFNPYTPRHEQLNRQELERLQSIYDERDGFVLSLEAQKEVDVALRGADQRSGISSVSIIDKRGQRQAVGADFKKRGKRHRDASDRSQRSLKSLPLFPSHTELPKPFTDVRLQDLLADCQRRQLAAAAQQRIDSHASSSEAFHQPFTNELSKAFASLDGFLTAFSKDTEEPEPRHTDTMTS